MPAALSPTRLWMIASVVFLAAALGGCGATRYARMQADACSSGDPWACQSAAASARAGANADPERACRLTVRALQLWAGQCLDQDDRDACRRVESGLRDVRAAAVSAEERRCVDASLDSDAGGRVRAHYIALLRRDCVDPSDEACFAAIAELLVADDSGAALGFEVVSRGCEAGDASACMLLVKAHREGLGTERNEAVAAAIQVAWCEERGWDGITCGRDVPEAQRSEFLTGLRTNAAQTVPYGIDGRPIASHDPVPDDLVELTVTGIRLPRALIDGRWTPNALRSRGQDPTDRLEASDGE